MVTASTVTPLFDALAAFHSAHPGIEIELVEDTSDRLLAPVLAGTMDVALAATAGAPPSDLESLTIVSEGLAAAVPAGHPLVGSGGVALAQLTTFPIVTLPAGTGVRTVLDLACAGSGLSPGIALQCSAPDAVVDLAVRGLGVAVLSASMAASYRDRLTAVPILGIDTAAVLSLVWTTPESAALRELLAQCRHAFRR